MKSTGKPTVRPVESSGQSSPLEQSTERLRADVGARMKEIRGSEDQAVFAETLNISTGTLGRYERGERWPDAPVLAALALKRDVSADWLLTGAPPKEYSARWVTHGRILAEQIQAKYYGSESFFLMPLYDIRAAAGYGALVEDQPPTDYRAFSRIWLSQEIRVQPFERLALVTIAGNSMEPDLHDGDVVMIDKGDTEVLREGAYVFFLDGHVFVKRLALRGDRLLIISSNGDHAQQELKLLQEHVSFKVIGRVIGQPLFKRI